MDKNKAKSKLAKLCSIKEICRHDAMDKLHKWEIFNDAEEIIDWLEDEKFIEIADMLSFMSEINTDSINGAE